MTTEIRTFKCKGIIPPFSPNTVHFKFIFTKLTFNVLERRKYDKNISSALNSLLPLNRFSFSIDQIALVHCLRSVHSLVNAFFRRQLLQTTGAYVGK